MEDCLFCDIAAGKRGELIWQNDVAAAFKDINPKAPVHILVVPKRHVASLDHLEDPTLGGQLLQAVAEVAAETGVKGGYKIIVNVGRSGGQVIDHLHFHILGGKQFSD